jgi:predicted nuclease of predicted toxin-antitoxin system
MILLFDQNLSFRLVSILADVFPGAKHVRDLTLTQSNDQEIWNVAKKNGFIVVSQDADFAEMAALHGPPPKVVWLRCGNQSTSATAVLLRAQSGQLEAFDKDADAACMEIY